MLNSTYVFDVLKYDSVEVSSEMNCVWCDNELEESDPAQVTYLSCGNCLYHPDSNHVPVILSA